ncbi:MAG: helix-turn-helix domain-containing protein [Prolixibacteraceae bacterium]|nr:helix-turn-helix domain-containing protein [Prolixibacteraceae bacterium]
MHLQLELSENMKSELKTLIQDSLKQELKALISGNQERPENDNKMLNRKQASKLLGCSLTTLYHYQRKGLIPYHQVGRKLLFNRSDLLNHLKVKTEFR